MNHFLLIKGGVGVRGGARGSVRGSAGGCAGPRVVGTFPRALIANVNLCKSRKSVSVEKG